MLGYLKRGQAYRRRGEFAAAMRDLRRASDIDPSATRPLEELGDAYLADTAAPLRLAPRTAIEAYVRLDPRAQRALQARRSRATTMATPPRPSMRCSGRSRSTTSSRRPITCSASASATRSSPIWRASPSRSRSRCSQRCCTRARSWRTSTALLGRTDDRLEQLETLSRLDAGASSEIALGMAYARAGQQDRAVTTLGRAAERYPDYPYAYVALGRVWLEIAQARNDRIALSKAIEALEGAVGSDDSSEALTLFGRALLLTSDEETAERMLQDATQKRPVEPLAFYYLVGRRGAARPLRRRPSRARSTTRSCAAMNPTPAAGAPLPRASATCR